MKVILINDSRYGKEIIREKVTHIQADEYNVTLTYGYGSKAMCEDLKNIAVKEVMDDK